MHLIKHSAFRAEKRGGRFVLLGSAPDPKVQVREGAGMGDDIGMGHITGEAERFRKHLKFKAVERGGQFVLLGSAPSFKVKVRGWLGFGMKGLDKVGACIFARTFVPSRPHLSSNIFSPLPWQSIWLRFRNS